MLKAWVLETEDTRYRFYQIALSRDVLVLVPVVTQCPERESFQPWVPIVAQSLSGTPFTRLLMLHLLLLSLPQPQGQQGAARLLCCLLSPGWFLCKQPLSLVSLRTGGFLH